MKKWWYSFYERHAGGLIPMFWYERTIYPYYSGGGEQSRKYRITWLRRGFQFSYNSPWKVPK